jgi:hypothetical protein
MPNPAARAAHKEAQTVYAKIGEVQSQEAAVIAAMKANPADPDMAGELHRLSRRWNELNIQYRAAMAKYTSALQAEHPR